MVRLAVLLLGIAAFSWSDLASGSIFTSVVLPLVSVATVLYAMALGLYLMRGKRLGRERQEDADLRFLAHMSADLGQRGRKNGGDRTTKPVSPRNE